MSKKKKKRQTPETELPTGMNTVYTNELTGAVPAELSEDDDEEEEEYL